MNETLASKLLQSKELGSLNAERRIAAFMRSLGWDARHTYYYVDVDSKKWREIDVLSIRSWTNEGRIVPLVRVWLPIELKNISDFNIIVSKEDDDRDVRNKRYWFGRHKDDVVKAISHSVYPEVAQDFLMRSDDLAFPRGRSVVCPVPTEPPEATVTATAFREIKPGKERNLENSVLWKAVMGIRSTLDSFDEWLLMWHLEMFDISAGTAFGMTRDQFLDDIMNIWFTRVLMLDIIHSIIIIDASILSWDGGHLDEVPSVTLIIDKLGGDKIWIDVVKSTEAEKVLGLTADHYNKVVGEGFERLLLSVS